MQEIRKKVGGNNYEGNEILRAGKDVQFYSMLNMRKCNLHNLSLKWQCCFIRLFSGVTNMISIRLYLRIQSTINMFNCINTFIHAYEN